MGRPKLGIFEVDQDLVSGFEGVVAYKGEDGHPVITKEFRDWMMAEQEMRCGYCAEVLDKPTIDHIHPRRAGGGNSPPNLMMVCKACNSQKKDRHYSFMRFSLRLRDAGLSDVITVCQATTLIEMGADLKLADERPLHFEVAGWPHVRPYHVKP